MKNSDESNRVNANFTLNTNSSLYIANKNSQEKPQNTNNKKRFFFWNKNKKKIIIGVVSIMIIVAVVLIIVFSIPNKKDSNELNNSSQNDNSNINSDDSGQNNNSEDKEDDYITLPNNEKVVTKLNYNINELSVYNEQSNTTMTYSYDLDSSLRRLTETITTIKNYKYLSFIYDIKNTSEGIEQYSAYFTVLEKFTEENGENNYDFFNNFIDNNLDELNDNSDSSEMIDEDFKIKPILKAIFYQNGTIGDILYPEGVNEELKSNVVNIIEKITPILSQKNYTKNLRLLDATDENKHVLTYEKDKNEGSTKLNEKKVEKNKDYGTFSIEDSKINSNIERTINSDNKIGKIISNSETNLISNISNQIDKPNYGGLVDLNEDSGDENNVIKFPIGSISTNNSESMELIKNNQNETLKDFFIEYIKDYKYISTKNVNNDNKRRLSNLFNVNPNEVHLINETNTKYINNINDLRNLAEKYNVLQQQINYAFSLAKTNIAGFKFGIMAVMSFSPQNGTILFKVICRTDKEEINIGNYNITTNYDKLIDVISKISDVYQNKITQLYAEFSNNFFDWKKNILKNLKTLTNYIKDPYNMVDIFSLPLSNLYNKIREISLDNFSEVKTDIIKVDEDLLVIKEELNSDSETNTKKILLTSKSDFSSFIENTEKLFNDFHKKTLEMISDILNKLEKVDN